jgi:hypothetical protein
MHTTLLGGHIAMQTRLHHFVHTVGRKKDEGSSHS